MDIKMNNDRELLELAAKAIGHGLEWVSVKHDDEPEPRLVTKNPYWFNWPKWNPLTDDGDALRLAVKLRLSLSSFKDQHSGTEYMVATPSCAGEGIKCRVDNMADSSMRRAIVRAAAEIGRGLCEEA